MKPRVRVHNSYYVLVYMIVVYFRGLLQILKAYRTIFIYIYNQLVYIYDVEQQRSHFSRNLKCIFIIIYTISIIITLVHVAQFHKLSLIQEQQFFSLCFLLLSKIYNRVVRFKWFSDYSAVIWVLLRVRFIYHSPFVGFFLLFVCLKRSKFDSADRFPNSIRNKF